MDMQTESRTEGYDADTNPTPHKDTGYQYKPGSFCSNGYPVGDNNLLFQKTVDPWVYIYTMGPNACSITCEFEKADNEMDVQSENVGDASIDMRISQARFSVLS